MEIRVSHSSPLFLSLFATLFMIAFSFTNPFMAAPYIVSDLGGSNEISIYNIALFGIGSALSVPLGKTFIARFHLRKVLVYGVLIMAFFTFTCGISPNFPIYLIQRFLLGFAAGPIYPAFTLALSKLLAPELKPRGTSIFVTLLTVVPVVGAAWGGFLAYEYNWRWIDYINIPLFLILAVALHRSFRGIDISIEKKPFDAVGYLFFFIGVCSLSIAAITAQQLDWYRSPTLVALTLIGTPCFFFFILWSSNVKYPILELKLFANSLFTFAQFNLALLFACYFGMLSLLSLWLKLYVNYTPFWISTALGTMVIAGIFPRFLIEERFGKVDTRWPLAIAIVLLAISCFHTTTFDVEINFGRIAFSRVIAGFGLALFLPPIFQMSFRAHPAEKGIEVIEIFQVTRNLACGLGAALFNIVWQRRESFFHERLGEKLNVFSMQTAQFFAKVKQLRVPGDPNAQLGYFLDRRATSLALDDTFWLMAWILVGLFILLITTIPWTKNE